LKCPDVGLFQILYDGTEMLRDMEVRELNVGRLDKKVRYFAELFKINNKEGKKY
jgi:hypothetical protein